jgi:hypothetical protein
MPENSRLRLPYLFDLFDFQVVTGWNFQKPSGSPLTILFSERLSLND